MKKQQKPDSQQASLFIVLCIARYCKVRKKKVTRVIFSESTFKNLCGRQRLRQEFLLKLEDALLERGWILVKEEDFFGVIKASAVKKWSRIADKKIQQVLEKFCNGELQDQEWEELEQEVIDFY